MAKKWTEQKMKSCKSKISKKELVIGIKVEMEHVNSK